MNNKNQTTNIFSNSVKEIGLFPELAQQWQQEPNITIKSCDYLDGQRSEFVLIPLAKLPWLKKQLASSAHRNLGFAISLKSHEKRKLIADWFKVEFQQIYFPKEIINLFKLKGKEQHNFLTGEQHLEQILTNRNLTK